jgi:hypothetical protein
MRLLVRMRASSLGAHLLEAAATGAETRTCVYELLWHARAGTTWPTCAATSLPTSPSLADCCSRYRWCVTRAMNVMNTSLKLLWAGANRVWGCKSGVGAGANLGASFRCTALHRVITSIYFTYHTFKMDEPRRSDRKRSQTQFQGAKETHKAHKSAGAQAKASRAREAAVGSAHEPLGGLVQLGAVGGGEGRVWSTAIAHLTAWTSCEGSSQPHCHRADTRAHRLVWDGMLRLWGLLRALWASMSRPSSPLTNRATTSQPPHQPTNRLALMPQGRDRPHERAGKRDAGPSGGSSRKSLLAGKKRS